jgi:hypothetical protein
MRTGGRTDMTKLIGVFWDLHERVYKIISLTDYFVSPCYRKQYKTHVVIQVKWLILLYDFNKIWSFPTNVIRNPNTILHQYSYNGSRADACAQT